MVPRAATTAAVGGNSRWMMLLVWGEQAKGREKSLMKASAFTMEMQLKNRKKFKLKMKLEMTARNASGNFYSDSGPSVQNKYASWRRRPLLACAADIAAERHRRLLIE
jgi:hypothetical protein